MTTIACIGSAVALQFLAPDLASSVSPLVLVPVVILAEVSMLGYLLIRGVNAPRAADTQPPAHDTPGAPAAPIPHVVDVTQHTYRR